MNLSNSIIINVFISKLPTAYVTSRAFEFKIALRVADHNLSRFVPELENSENEVIVSEYSSVINQY